MAVLLLAQRASLLKFREDVNQVSSRLAKPSDGDMPMAHVDEVITLQAEFVRFVNRLWFTEVTAQEQGIELHDLMRTQMNLTATFKELSDTISELNDLVNLMEDKQSMRHLNSLNVVAVYLLPFSVVFAFWGANFVFSSINGLAGSSSDFSTCDIATLLVQGSLLLLFSVLFAAQFTRALVADSRDQTGGRHDLRAIWRSLRRFKVWIWLLLTALVYVWYFGRFMAD
jgi:Mg2+ and Co2+ transporter CorA